MSSLVKIKLVNEVFWISSRCLHYKVVWWSNDKCNITKRNVGVLCTKGIRYIYWYNYKGKPIWAVAFCKSHCLPREICVHLSHITAKSVAVSNIMVVIHMPLIWSPYTLLLIKFKRAQHKQRSSCKCCLWRECLLNYNHYVIINSSLFVC